MEPLTTEFTRGRYTFQQVVRQGRLAIFEQRHKDSETFVRYEVIKIQHQREHTWQDGTTTPAKEAYPSSASWGRLAWTCFTRQEADALLAQLQARADDPAQEDDVRQDDEEDPDAPLS